MSWHLLAEKETKHKIIASEKSKLLHYELLNFLRIQDSELYIIAFLSGIFYVATLIIFFSAQTTSIKSKKNSKKF